MALTDVFFKRYRRLHVYSPEGAVSLHPFFIQVAGIVFDDLAVELPDRSALFKKVEVLLAREIGCGVLILDASSKEEGCGRFLVERYDLWNDRHGDPDWFVRTRLSLIELMFRFCEEKLAREEPKKGGIFGALDNALVNRRHRAFRDAVAELNVRMREARVPFHYHNGFLQAAADEPTSREIEEPFWEVVRDPMWRNVDGEMKRALDLRDQSDDEAAFHAMKALESAIKVVSDSRGWTTGNEKGAANFVDNLVSKSNGRFLDPWEGDVLRVMFREVRNPRGHGAGSDDLRPMSSQQVDVVVETAMTWIKSLARRL